jgi:hypothetical protein
MARDDTSVAISNADKENLILLAAASNQSVKKVLHDALKAHFGWS